MNIRETFCNLNNEVMKEDEIDNYLRKYANKLLNEIGIEDYNNI